MELKNILGENSHLTGVEAEARTGEGTCPRAQTGQEREPGHECTRKWQLSGLAHGPSACPEEQIRVEGRLSGNFLRAFLGFGAVPGTHIPNSRGKQQTGTQALLSAPSVNIHQAQLHVEWGCEELQGRDYYILYITLLPES